MITDDVRKLLGGYATNTLTEAERKALFEAAVDDQDLFNALQDEQALRDLLDDPSSRQLVRQALDVPREARPSRGRVWVWACSCAAIAAGVIAFIVFRPQPQQPRPLEVAQNTNASAPVPEEAAQTSSPPAPPLAVENKPIEKKAEAAASAQFGAGES